MECEAGSLIVWGGTTWHGSYPRSASGVRVTVIDTVRSYMKTIPGPQGLDPAGGVRTQQSRVRPASMGMQSAYPIGDGPDMAKTRPFTEAGRTPRS